MASKKSSFYERRFVPKGGMIVKEGEEGTAAFLIQSGLVEVFGEQEEKTITFSKLGPGDIFGEMALFQGEIRTASVKALEDTNLIIITKPILQEKLDATDPTIRAMFKMLISRMAENNQTIINKKSDLQDLMESLQMVFNNVLNALPKNQQRIFQNSAGTKLQEMIEAIKGFEDRFKS